jgi:hypothetical protein
VSDLVSQAIERLRVAGVTLAHGLSDDEFAMIEETFGFAFGAEHRALLSAVLPTGESWMDWRAAPRKVIQGRLDWPTDGVVFDVHNNGFWPSPWGQRPADRDLSERRAREHLAHVPKLVPIFGHRCLPASPAPIPSPVFSVYQTDVIYYGDNLLDYVANEFNALPLNPAKPGERPHIAFWSDLADGVEPAEL